ncbi:hypothetical protein HYV70_00250 [Candidatus Uhrbacteria bacterium]|nr:hypothetical protein [Candidatus Uhrbacteria bacterium]
MDEEHPIKLSWGMRAGLMLGRLFCGFMAIVSAISGMLLLVCEIASFVIMLSILGVGMAKLFNPVDFIQITWGEIIIVQFFMVLAAVLIAVIGALVAILGTFIYLSGHLMEPAVIGEVRFLVRDLVHGYCENRKMKKEKE